MTTLSLKFESNSKGKEYKVEGIQNSTVYVKESESDHLPSLYYLIS